MNILISGNYSFKYEFLLPQESTVLLYCCTIVLGTYKYLVLEYVISSYSTVLYSSTVLVVVIVLRVLLLYYKLASYSS